MSTPLLVQQQGQQQQQQQQPIMPGGGGGGALIPSGPNPTLSAPTDREQMIFSVRSAEDFVRAYYAATDSPNRVRVVPLLYSPTASIVWNGTPVPAVGDAAAAGPSNGAEAGANAGSGGLAALLASMPGSKHDVTTFDAHPLGWGTGADGIPALRSILVNVSGIVQHHTPVAALRPSNAPRSSSDPVANGVTPEAIMALPRMFSQQFVLIDGAGTGEQGGVRVFEERTARVQGAPVGSAQAIQRTARWYVQSDSFRFVG
ncbi:hypothetical protein OC861_001411 [Tilletia horrida]|nr:hypothetical protein OC861_001411 [Tilletia horrida]